LDVHLQDLRTLNEIVAGLDRLEARLDSSPIPQAVAGRGYLTPDEDDRVRQSVLAYRNYRLGAYEIILRYRDYALIAPKPAQLRSFMLAFGAALVLYAKSLRIIEFAEHAPMLRAKINEPDAKFDMPAGFFDDVVAGYSQLSNYRSLRQADSFWRAHRQAAQETANQAGADWQWLAALIRRQRKIVRRRLTHVLLERLRHDWRAFWRTAVSPARQARHGLEGLISDRLAEAHPVGEPTWAIRPQLLPEVRDVLKPGDILLMRNDSRITAALIPGFWTHVALFLGGQADFEQLELRAHPHAAKHWARIPNNADPLGLVIEAVCPCVQINPLEKCLQVDHLLVLRPDLSREEMSAAMDEAIGQLDKPYDFEFDFNSSTRVVCTELIYRTFHSRGSIAFSLVKRLGRFTLSGDDIVAQAIPKTSDLAKTAALQPVALILKLRDGRLRFASSERILPMLRRLLRGWRPTRRGAAVKDS
jgi:hypothetical protein